MRSNAVMQCYILIICTLVKLSLPRSLLKNLPDGFEEHTNHYNPEENLGATLFLAEGDILIDRDEYYSMLGLENNVPDRWPPRLGHRIEEHPSNGPFNTPRQNGASRSSRRFRSGQRQKRSIDSAYYLMWMSRSVPYEFDANFGPTERTMVEKAMSVLENASCIKFTKRNGEVDYVYILVPPGGGCYSNVGRKGGRQDIGLSSECHFGTVIHELLHSLGFWHEHNRKDREEFITVLWDNIKIDKKDNFQIPVRKGTRYTDVVLQKDYDYGSIMHYANNTFSKNGIKPTIRAKNPLPAGVQMGQRNWPSNLDIEKLNVLYMCEIRNCPQPPRMMNGNVDAQTFTVGSKVAYRCLPGYVLIGAAERQCLTTGQWSGNQPSCLPNTTRDPLHYCNFDRPSHSFCGWTQSTDDGLDWIFYSGATFTKYTGPYWDNTLTTVSGVYIYVESSDSVRGTGQIARANQARLISPRFEANTHSSLCLVFFTYMYGKYMGSLSVYKQTEDFTTNTSTPTEELLFRIEGDQGREWRQVFLVLGKMAVPFNIILEGTIGGYTSDIAIDDLTVGSCKDFKPLALSGSLSNSTGCSFDNGNICDFVQDRNDTADWIINSGATRTLQTGPRCDPINCESGFYLYLESSFPRRTGDTAKLKTPVLGGHGPTCLSFYYHMYGASIGTLQIKMVSTISGNEYTLWVKIGDQGNRWFPEHKQFEALEAYRISIEAVRGNSFKGDIAIDRVIITAGACSGLINFNCSFEHGMCGWTNVSPPGDQKDWQIHTGETDTPNTGPSSDRTDAAGHFLYVESSRSLANDTARLISPAIQQTGSGYCLGFWYNMHGSTIGKLVVLVQSEIGQEEVVWTKCGNQGLNWIFQELNLTSFPSQSIYVIFQVQLRQGYEGDTAIDDISIYSGRCHNSNV